MMGPVPEHLYVSDYKVYKTLCALKTKKSPGPDEIPNVVWKEFAFALSPALADIYNSSLEQGYFPTQLKQAIVVPVPKIRPPKSVENDLRPISLTSPIAKVLEGFSAESLIISVFNNLDNKQFALPVRSTTQALIFFMHTILETLDTCGKCIRFFFSDFSKGFDLVDHNVLLSELNNLDVDPHLVRWIVAFLTNRSQRVRIGNSLSPPIGLNGGTSQGTKRAPLLLCILVNGMAAKCKSRVKYVDDATAMEIIPRCSPSYLPFTVSDIYTYASLRGMKLNLKKCKEMIINFMQYSPFPPVPLTVGGSVIERVLTYKLLGVYISEDLSWNVHIEHIVKKANKRLYALRTLKKSGITTMQLVQVYCSIVRSVLEYACPVWAALPKYLDDAIESVQKRALRIVLPNCHYDDVLIQSGITTLSQRREEACTNFIKRDCLSSPVLKPLIPCVSIDRPYCLRSGERVPVRFVPKTKRFADFCTIKYQDQL